jgi:hypothetical protein
MTLKRLHRRKASDNHDTGLDPNSLLKPAAFLNLGFGEALLQVGSICCKYDRRERLHHAQKQFERTTAGRKGSEMIGSRHSWRPLDPRSWLNIGRVEAADPADLMVREYLAI